MEPCDVCDRSTERTGAVCQHLVHGELLTYNASSADLESLPDLACTECYFDYHAKGDVPEVWSKMEIHMVCVDCYRKILAKHVLPTPEEQERGFALVDADKYFAVDANAGQRPPRFVGSPAFVKLGFCPIPSAYPKGIEKMWVRLDGTTEQGAQIGVLDNDPSFFAPKVLREGSVVEFRSEHVLEALED